MKRPSRVTIPGRPSAGIKTNMHLDESHYHDGHLYVAVGNGVDDLLHLPRESVVKLRDYLTAWLEYDPDAELREEIMNIRSSRGYSADEANQKIIDLVREHDKKE
jgi:hypothetical protein